MLISTRSITLLLSWSMVAAFLTAGVFFGTVCLPASRAERPLAVAQLTSSGISAEPMLSTSAETDWAAFSLAVICLSMAAAVGVVITCVTLATTRTAEGTDDHHKPQSLDDLG